MAEIDFSLLNDFIVEASEHLEEMENQLLELKPGQDNKELCNDIFRPIHTIKGASQFVGLDRVSSLSHRLEDMLDLLRNGELETTTDVVDVLIEGRDRIAALTKDLENHEREDTEVGDLVAKVSYMIEHEGNSPPAGVELAHEEADEKDSDAEEELTLEGGFEEGLGELEDEDLEALLAEAEAAETLEGEIPMPELLDPSTPEPTEAPDASTTLREIEPDEEYDEELFEIFLQQLIDKTELVGMLSRALEGGEEDHGILEECALHVERLRSAANYMGYDDLVAFYVDWAEQISASVRMLEAGQGYPPGFMTAMTNTLVAAVPQLREAGLEVSAAEAAEPFDPQLDAEEEEHDLDPSEVRDFVDQAVEHLGDMEQGLLRFEEEPENPTHLDDVFRAAHTIKGVAQFVGLPGIAGIAHRMEDLLARVRQGDQGMSPQVLTVLMASRDRLELLTDDLIRAGTEVAPVDDILERLGRSMELEEEGSTPEQLTSELLHSHSETDEPYDQELYTIFVNQLGELVARVRSALQRFDGAERKGEVLDEIEQHVRHLRHGASYMGYSDLEGLYSDWLQDLEKSHFEWVEGETPSLDSSLMRIATIEAMFPDLAGAEGAPSGAPSPEAATVADTPAAAEREPTPPSADATERSTPTTLPEGGEEALMVTLTAAMQEREGDRKAQEYETLHGVFEEMLGDSEPESLEGEPTKAPPAAPAPERQRAAPRAEPKAAKPKASPPPAAGKAAEQADRAPKTPASAPQSPAETKAAAPATATADGKKGAADGKGEATKGDATKGEKSDRVFKKSVRVDADKIDSLMNQVGELIVDRSYFFTLFNEMHDLQNHLKDDLGIDTRDLKQVRLFNYRLGEAISSLSRTSNDLQEGVMKVRMLPIAQIFNRYPRLIHDLTNRTNKRVNLVINGEETELDKMIVEELSDPLIHIIRNAVDHGFEAVDERKRAGKPEAGTLVVEAYQESNHIVIEVRDDGRGIDTNRIKAKALEKKLHTKDELDRMNQRDLMRLVMHAGFSTADKISRTSGRGVGMDVAKKNIEKLNGTIELDSKVGVGTSIRLKIPLTLAIIPALLVRVGRDSFTIPLSNVEETLRINAADTSMIENTEVVHLRGKTMPIFRLATLFNLDVEELDDDKSFVVMVNAGAEQVGLVVDELLGQEEVVIKPLVDYLQERSGFSGATIIGDGRISLILDVYELVNMTANSQVKRIKEREASRRAAMQAARKAQTSHQVVH